MWLSEVERPTTLVEVHKDAEFENLGMLFSQSSKVLAPLYDRRYIERELVKNPSISAVVTTRDLVDRLPDGLGVAVADNPKAAVCRIHLFLMKHTVFYGENFTSQIDPTAEIAPTATIASINVRIGAHVRIGAGTVVNERTTIGDNCVIGEGCIIGADGLDPCLLDDGHVINVPHAGAVVLEDNVTLLAGVVICRAKHRSATFVGRNTVAGIRAIISHSTKVGRNCRICAGASISGSCRLEDDVYLGPQATISNRVSLGKGSRVSIGSVVVQDVEPGKTVSGNFAIDHKDFLRSRASMGASMRKNRHANQ